MAIPILLMFGFWIFPSSGKNVQKRTIKNMKIEKNLDLRDTFKGVGSNAMTIRWYDVCQISYLQIKAVVCFKNNLTPCFLNVYKYRASYYPEQ